MHRVLLKTSPIFITNPLFEFRNNSRNIRILIAPNYYSRERSDTSITHSFFFWKKKTFTNTFDEEGCRRPPLFSTKLGNKVFVKDNKVTTRWNTSQSSSPRAISCLPLPFRGLNVIYKLIGCTWRDLRVSSKASWRFIVGRENWKNERDSRHASSARKVLANLFTDPTWL